MTDAEEFDAEFHALTGHCPLSWQRRLFRCFLDGNVPGSLDLPTGLGKTSVIAIWLIARAHGARLPRRLVYVVDRRAVVDQATDEAVRLRKALDGESGHFGVLGEGARESAKQAAADLRQRLGGGSLPISTLRGAYTDNREWLEDPAAPAIIVGTVDMIGSRLLFEGYGVSRRTRSYQAGLLGIDSLIVLDEAHLVPPFAHLVHAIEQEPSIQPESEDWRLQRLVFLPLSATQRTRNGDGYRRAPFRLEAEDWKCDAIVRQRLTARKHLCLRPLADRDASRQLAEAAWTLASANGQFSRVVVFCDRRDEGGEPTVKGVKNEIEKLAKNDPVLLVGARRVHEREVVAERLRELGFIGEKKPLERPAFLLATAAGEVGVDIDADHMVSDLVPWERMVQRLGRVNRRGEGAAEAVVFWSEPQIRKPEAPTEAEERALLAFRCKGAIERLPHLNAGFDASPGALRELVRTAQTDAALGALIDGASTPEPLYPALNRALVDAWSMTSLEVHPGRPEVAPWLRGWLPELPQTAVIWRDHLPIREDAGAKEIEAFFEAAPPHESEKLATESYRIEAWLRERGKELLKLREAPGALQPGDIAAVLLSSSGDYAGRLTLAESAQDRKGTANDQFVRKLAGKTLVVDARLAGLRDGLLDKASGDPVETADASMGWSRQTNVRVRRIASPADASSDPEWRFEYAFDLIRDGEGEPVERLIVKHFRGSARREDARAIARPQELSVHESLVADKMLRIAQAVGLPGAAAKALAVGAGLHDEGKRAPRWQRAFQAERDAARCGLSGPLAKTSGPISQEVLNGYRHEFGSLPFVEANAEFAALPPDWRELILHLIAAHHGRGRPVIETRGCADAPPSALEERARVVALRFARLQKRWGPWGLAWWEALLRAADQQASRAWEETE